MRTRQKRLRCDTWRTPGCETMPLIYRSKRKPPVEPRMTKQQGGGRVVRWYLINFQCRGVLLIWSIVGQGSTALAVGAGGGCLDIFSLVCRFSFLSPPLWETARYRLKYCLKGPLSPKQPTNQPTKQQTRLSPFPTKLNKSTSLMLGPSLSLMHDQPACN